MLKYKLWLVLSMILAGCLSRPTALPPEPTSTATPTGTPTATVIWFPATATQTPLPTLDVSPTVDQLPPTGDLIFSDDFNDPDEWLLGQTSTTSIALGNQALTLALNQPSGYLYTLRKSPILSDFYLEVTASPSLCRGDDEYGLLLRVSPSAEFYRFSLSCEGSIRLDKYYNGKASSPQAKTPSGSVPRGAPSSSLISAWVKGKEMQFYVNNEYQFTVRDPSLQEGSLGFFVRSAGDTALTVSFTNLSVRTIPN